MDWTGFADEELVSAGRAVPGSAVPALARSRAVEACVGFLKRDVCVLGGDLYIWNGVKFRAAQGWGLDREPDEPWPSFRDRSISTAIREIEREMDLADGDQPFFVLVCSTEVETAKHMYGG